MGGGSGEAGGQLVFALLAGARQKLTLGVGAG